MLVRILKPARVHHAPGEVVEVGNPAELNYLISTGSAEVLRAAAPENPEAAAPVETRVIPAETRKTAPKRTTAAKTTARKK